MTLGPVPILPPLRMLPWAALAAACQGPSGGVECFIPTYDVPAHELAEVEARHLSSMCTESWAKRWAVHSAESAGDVADAVIAQCDTPYWRQGEATWPRDKWPVGTILENLPEIERSWRAVAIKHVILTREHGCTELRPLSKYQWTPRN